MNVPIETYLLLGFGLSVVVTIGGVVVIGVVLVKLPPDNFVAPTGRQPIPNSHPLVRWAVLLLRNLLGATLVVLGLIMSAPGIPGPGIMMIMIGLMVMDFAEKR